MDLKELTKQLNVEFKDIKFLKTALTHRSYLNEVKEDGLEHNERLEFLGDAVLELIISEYLYSQFPDKPEGDLTSFRAATVRTESLANVSKSLGVGQFLIMSKGEEATGGREKDYLLANAFEAILGAIYLDQGYEVAKTFVAERLIPQIKNIVKYRLDIDSKTKFQEQAQSTFKRTPIYKVVGSDGPDHDKTFTMAVYIDNEEFGRGTGHSKQKAEEMAAEKGLEKINNMNNA
jgi:ribonuclease-3